MIIRDSSLYPHPASMPNRNESDIRIGIVREENYFTENDSYMYKVDVQTRGRRYTLMCRQAEKFGDAYNYEEWKSRAGGPKTPLPSPPNFGRMVGEVVVVAHIDGGQEGIILGCLRHPSRKSKLLKDKMSYISEYNGVETSIDNDGAYKLKFQGTPINALLLKALPAGAPIPPPIYNPLISGSFMGFDKEGSYTLSDAATVLPQTIKIDKTGGKISIISGPVSIIIEKLTQKITISNIDTEISSKKSFKITTLDTEISSLKSVKIKSAKIAIGFGGVELLDTIVKFMEQVSAMALSLSTETHTGNLGYPTSPPLNLADYIKVKAQVEILKAKVSLIKGGL
jgi:hypothetical protein